jgi:RNA polymerase sigma-70 factor (ECF subfamily)
MIDDVKLAKRGDRDAFARLFLCHEAHMYRIARAILCSEFDSADALQETAIRAWKQLPGLKDETRFESWLTRILVRESCRIAGRKQPEPLTHDVQTPSTTAESEMRLDVAHILMRLPLAQRTALSLHYLQDMPVDRIAALLGVPKSTVKTRLRRGRKTLGAYLRRITMKIFDDYKMLEPSYETHEKLLAALDALPPRHHHSIPYAAIAACAAIVTLAVLTLATPLGAKAYAWAADIFGSGKDDAVLVEVDKHADAYMLATALPIYAAAPRPQLVIEKIYRDDTQIYYALRIKNADQIDCTYKPDETELSMMRDAREPDEFGAVAAQSFYEMLPDTKRSEFDASGSDGFMLQSTFPGDGLTLADGTYLQPVSSDQYYDGDDLCLWMACKLESPYTGEPLEVTLKLYRNAFYYYRSNGIEYQRLGEREEYQYDFSIAPSDSAVQRLTFGMQTDNGYICVTAERTDINTHFTVKQTGGSEPINHFIVFSSGQSLKPGLMQTINESGDYIYTFTTARTEDEFSLMPDGSATLNASFK